MADLVLGLAKSAVEGTLTIAKSAIEEEKKLKKNMQRDLMLISDEFEMMHSFLNVSKERASDEMVKTVVRQVRNMALDVEDCIESVMLMDTKSQSHWWHRLLPYCILAMVPGLPAPALDEAVVAIELLKSRVEAMGQRNERYMNIGGGDSCPAGPTEKAQRPAVADTTAVGLLIEARNVLTKHRSPGDLIQLINKIDQALPLQVISVWGAEGDLGVASIIKKTCADPKISKKFGFRAWVKLTHPFNSHEFIRSLLAQFYANYCPQEGSSVNFLKPLDVMIATEGVLVEEFVKLVRDRRYLVFLEDVYQAVDLEAVRFYLPDKKNGSCIVVHTQQLEVASLCVGESHRVSELEQFSTDHSVFVFYNEAKKKRRSPGSLIDLLKEDAAEPQLRIINVREEVGHHVVAPITMKTCDKYEDICKSFKYRASLKLMHPFNGEEFVKNLLTELCTNYCLKHGSAKDFLQLKGVIMVITEGVLITEFVKQVMRNKKYLIFLEDVSSVDDLNAVREFLPDNNNGSCIVMHTQQLEVARLCTYNSISIFPSEDLDDDDDDDHDDEDEDADEDDDYDEDHIKRKQAKEWLDEHESKLVGRMADKESLLANSRGAVRPVFGMAGVGKSYLVRYVYYKQIVTPYTSYQKFGWVDVPHPFNIRDFSWRLLLDLHSGSLQHGTMLRIRDPIQQCRQLIKKDTCLIVIDGLQTKEEWDSMKAALQLDENNVKNGSLIIVIANEKSVAAHCAKHWWSVEGLEIDDALHLFNKTATRTNWWEVSFWPNDPSPSDIERATCVLHKCGGLPKVIVSVANAFADGWRIDVDSFMQMLMNNQAFGSLRDLFSWVDSYLRSFPDSLKPCIFYLSIFPVNHKIRRMRLVRRWVAEGYCMDTKEETAEEKGEQSCLELCRRNIVHVPGSTSMSYMMRMPPCQVNGFFREYIVSRSMEENLVFALEGHCSVNKQHTGRHLAIGSTWDRDMSVYRGIDVSRLRSLTVFGKWDSFFITDKMKLVRVLDLEDASSVTDCDLKLIVKLLPHLKFLSLRRCKEISHLPDSFGSLKQLQTLDIRHTSVVKLPQSIIKLQKLQHICAGTAVPMDGDSSTVESISPPLEAASASASMNRPCDATLVSQLKSWKPWTRCSQELPTCHNGGIEMPQGIGKMMALNKITVVDVSIACGRPILEELKNLTQLRKLGLSGIKREICEALCSAIPAFIHLESLSLWLKKNQTGCLDAISSPPEKLKILKLYGYTGKLPAWIHMLSNLSKLKIQKDMIMQDDVDLPNSLPNLNTLNLSSKEFQHGQFRFHPHFQQLQVLEINCTNRLQAVKFQPGVMPRIEVLRIFCHDVSSLRFSGLQQLINLRDVTLSGSYDERVKQSLELELGEYWQPCSTSSTSHGALVRWRRASL